MIEISHVGKKFGKKSVLDDINLNIDEEQIYGLIGYNGAGKTTLLKIINGIYRPEAGKVCINGVPVYENEKLKKQMFMMTEELFFLPQATLQSMEKFYRGYYEHWDTKIFWKLVGLFGLTPTQKISGFSKGMQRQAGLIIAFATGTKYLFLDEAFDGLDLGIRKLMRKILRLYVEEKKVTVILTSHNLQELEECVDKFGMIKDTKLICDLYVEDIKKSGKNLEEYFLQEKEESYDWETLFKE